MGVAFLNEKDRIAAGLSRGLCPKQQHSLAFLLFRSVKPFATGFFCRTTDVIIRVDFFPDSPMNQEPSTLYAKLLGETASITWKELEPFFAKGALLWVDPALDLIAAAEAVASDDGEKSPPGWPKTRSPSCLKRGRWIFSSVIQRCGRWW